MPKKKEQSNFHFKNIKLLAFEKNLHFTFSFLSNSGTTTVILGVVIPIAICLIIIVVMILLFRRKKNKSKDNSVELQATKPVEAKSGGIFILFALKLKK